MNMSEDKNGLKIIGGMVLKMVDKGTRMRTRTLRAVQTSKVTSPLRDIRPVKIGEGQSTVTIDQNMTVVKVVGPNKDRRRVMEVQTMIGETITTPDTIMTAAIQHMTLRKVGSMNRADPTGQ